MALTSVVIDSPSWGPDQQLLARPIGFGRSGDFRWLICALPVLIGSGHRPARVFEFRVTTAQAVMKGLHGHCAQPAVQPVPSGWWRSARRRASVTAWS
ncbi:hypothetical protein ABZS66_06670 [Dactylosporangium sp. NPDC005572]|uniref:hypothetical protein n=1 Tax=Dactylosporangium sp. NPDC005572 TaxID=3156889 RepID=UPI0033A0A3B1